MNEREVNQYKRWVLVGLLLAGLLKFTVFVALAFGLCNRIFVLRLYQLLSNNAVDIEVEQGC